MTDCEFFYLRYSLLIAYNFALVKLLDSTNLLWFVLAECRMTDCEFFYLRYLFKLVLLCGRYVVSPREI